MKKIILFIVLFIMSTPAFGISKEVDPVEMANTFFKMIEKNEIDKAYSYLFKDSVIVSLKPKAFDSLREKTSKILPLYGKIVGIEKYREEKIGTSIVRLLYIVKTEKAPTFWELFFYKPKSKWFLANMRLNDSFKLLKSLD